VGRLAELYTGRRPVTPVELPGRPDVRVGLRILTGIEDEEAQLAVLQRMRSLGIKGENLVEIQQLQEMVDRETAYQIVWRALVDLETEAPLADSVDELRQLMPVPDLQVLVDRLAELREEVVELDEQLTRERLDEEADELGKASAGVTSSAGTSAAGASISGASPPARPPTASSCGATSSSGSPSGPGRAGPVVRPVAPAAAPHAPSSGPVATTMSRPPERCGGRGWAAEANSTTVVECRGCADCVLPSDHPLPATPLWLDGGPARRCRSTGELPHGSVPPGEIRPTPGTRAVCPGCPDCLIRGE